MEKRGIDPSFPEKYLKICSRLKMRMLDKGVIFSGNPGSGKTKRVKFMAECIEGKVIDLRETITMLSGLTGSRRVIVMNDLIELSYGGKVVYLDDLGCESARQMNYGNASDIVGDIILARYRAFTDRKLLTFFTTNLNLDQLAEIYGERIRDRLREMCWFLRCDGRNYRTDDLQ